MIDYKKITNPFVLFPFIILAVYFLRINVFYSFTIFLVISLTYNIILVIQKKIDQKFYFFVYKEFILSLILILPLLYILNIKFNYIFIIFGLTDFLIQSYYNIFSRDGKKIRRLWKNKLLKTEKDIFHAISLKKYIYKHFSCKIIEPGHKNPIRNHILHHHFMKSKTPQNIIKHQYGNKNALVFNLKDVKIKKNVQRLKGILTDKKQMSQLKKIDKKIAKNIITCYKADIDTGLRIVFDKRFALNNPQKVYNFLKKVNKKLK